jgi:hypothetical protein
MRHGSIRPGPDVRRRSPRPQVRRTRTGTLATIALATFVVVSAPSASAASYEDAVGLGSADPYSVLAGSTVTNTGPTSLSGELGVSPGTAITGFPPGVAGGATHAGDANAASAQSSVTTAYVDAAGRPPTGTTLGSALAGGTLLAGVYNAGSSLDVSGAVTLDGEGDPNAVFIFQVGASLTTASSTSIVLTGNAQACNVYWQVGASATLGTTTTFAGTVLAQNSVSVGTGTTVAGRALARVGAVTLDNNVFTDPACVSTTTTTTVTATPATAGGSTTVTATVAAPGAATPTGTVTFTAEGAVVGTAPIGPDGVASITLPVGTPGDVTFVATYEGSGSYAPSTSPPTVLTISPVVVAPPVVVPPEAAVPPTTVPTRAAADAPSATTSAELARSGPVPAGTYALGAAVLILTGAILTAAAGQRSRRRAASVRAV